MNNYLAIIKSKFPSFVKRDYPMFNEMMGAYFEWLYQENNALEYLSNYLDEFDSSNENSRYWDKILGDLGYLLDMPITIQKRQLVVFLRDYYSARGSEQGLYFLFKLLFNDEPSVSYPREDMLIPSVALAESDKVIYVDFSNVEQKEIYKIKQEIANYSLSGKGETSLVSFIIDKCFVYGKVGKMIVSISEDLINFETIKLSTGLSLPLLCVLNVASIKSQSPVSKGLRLDIKGNRLNGDYRVNQVSSGKISEIIIDNSGENYKVGDPIIVVGSNSTGFYGEVSEVNGGSIMDYRILNSGYNMKTLPKLSVLSENGENAKLKPVSDTIGKPIDVMVNEPCVVDSSFTDFVQTLGDIECGLTLGTVFTSPKKRKMNTGTLGVNGVITDSYYYQQFSYRINSAIPKAEYAHKVKREHHPVGTVMLARLLISDETSISANLTTTIDIV